jgi:hypothetical protein
MLLHTLSLKFLVEELDAFVGRDYAGSELLKLGARFCEQE